MPKILIICIFTLFGISIAKIDNNQRGGHGLFNGLKDESSKPLHKNEIETSPNYPESEAYFSEVVSLSVVPDNPSTENINMKPRLSSLYLQPEPKGLHYLLGTPDHSPFLTHFFRKRDTRKVKRYIKNDHEQENSNHGQGPVIPGSRGQSVLYGVPGSPGLPSTGSLGWIPNAGNQNGYPGNYQNGFPGNYQNGFPGNNQNGFPGNNQNGFPGNNFMGSTGINQHQGGYKTHGY
ncbi:hypothetical protein HHI36_003095 [Cryptolaemus montrouzieri]|uniref:Uncharacterized protein n=1 Tax=Cryptolaemus montrouzieri TaxID=559131 RepID=A0ABD2PCY5_9CUCU